MFAHTINGYSIPLDAEPSDRGTLRIEDELAVYVPDLDRPRYHGRLYRMHSATCPSAKRGTRRPEPVPSPRYEGD